MAVLYSSNFDAETTGALPSGWMSINGVWQVSTLGAVSGTKTLASSTSTSAGVVIRVAESTADGTLTFSWLYQGDTMPCPIWRADAGWNNGYLFAITPSGNGITLFKRVANSYVNVSTQNIAGLFNAFVTGDVLSLEARFIGSIYELRVWKQGTARPISASASFTDSTFTTTGYSGVFQAIGPTTPSNGFDDYSFADTGGAPTPTPTPTPTSTTIARNATGIFYSPYNWDDDGNSKIAISNGAYVKFDFTGTSLSMAIVALTGLLEYPTFRAYIDDRPSIDITPVSGQTTISFATGLPDTTHNVVIMLKAIPLDGRWDRSAGLKPIGYVVDSGKVIGAPTGLIAVRPNRMLAFGDSITEGERVNSTARPPAGADAIKTNVPIIAEALNAEYGQVGHGGQGYAVAGVGGVPPFNAAYASYSNGRSRLTSGVFSPTPDFITNMHGVNGAPVSQANVATGIASMRGAAPDSRIFMLVPPGGRSRSGITAATNAAIAAGDTSLTLVDCGPRYQAGLETGVEAATEASTDGVHPVQRANARFAAQQVLQIQRAIEPRRFTVIAS